MLRSDLRTLGVTRLRTRHADSPLQIHAASSRAVALTLGFHECEFCPTESAFRGNGEYHYFLSNGDIYAAPAMLPHYVQEHGYRLPAGFREGLAATGELTWDGRAERLCEVLRDDSFDLDVRCQVISELPNWRDPRALEALLHAVQDAEIVDVAGLELGQSLASYPKAGLNVDDLPEDVKHGLAGREQQ